MSLCHCMWITHFLLQIFLVYLHRWITHFLVWTTHFLVWIVHFLLWISHMNNLVSFMKLDEPLGPGKPRLIPRCTHFWAPRTALSCSRLKLHGGMWGPGDELPIKFWSLAHTIFWWQRQLNRNCFGDQFAPFPRNVQLLGPPHILHHPH